MAAIRIEISGESGALSALFTFPQRTPKRVVLLLHGLCSEAKETLGVLEALAEEGAAGLAPDLPGHGASPGSIGLITLRSQIDAILYGVQWLRLRFPEGKVVLAGHSFGAHGVLMATSRIDPPPVLAAIIGAPRRSGENLPPMRRFLMRTGGFIFGFLGPLAPALAWRCPSGLDKHRLDLRTLAYAVRMNNIVAAATVPPSVNGLVIRGVNDSDTTTGSVQSLFNALGSRRKRLMEIPNAGHSPFHGQPARLLARALTEEWNGCAA